MFFQSKKGSVSLLPGSLFVCVYKFTITLCCSHDSLDTKGLSAGPRADSCCHMLLLCFVFRSRNKNDDAVVKWTCVQCMGDGPCVRWPYKNSTNPHLRILSRLLSTQEQSGCIEGVLSSLGEKCVDKGQALANLSLGCASVYVLLNRDGREQRQS